MPLTSAAGLQDQVREEAGPSRIGTCSQSRGAPSGALDRALDRSCTGRIRLPAAGRDLLDERLAESWRLVAPEKLLAELDDPAPG